MEEMTDFCYDLLLKVISLSLQPKDCERWEDFISCVDGILKEEYIEACDNAGKRITLTGFSDTESIEENIVYRISNCYLWCFFSYTYYLAGENKIVRRKFLWISLLLPYLYKMNKFGMESVEELNEFLKNYPISEDTLKTLNDDVGKFCSVMKGVKGVNDLMPTPSSIDVVVEEAKAGLKVAMLYIRRQE